MKTHVITKPVKVSELTFDDLYEEISHNWRQKAERLQARRWRALKHASTGTSYMSAAHK